MNLSDAVAGEKHRKRKRLGRGPGSGRGKTAGHGQRGARTRSGETIAATYTGGQMPLFRRLPKRGFNNSRFRKRPATINVGDLIHWPGQEEVNPESLLAAGLVDDISHGVKVLGNGDVSRPLTVKVTAFSAAAREKILAAGGKADVLAPAPKAEPQAEKDPKPSGDEAAEPGADTAGETTVKESQDE